MHKLNNICEKYGLSSDLNIHSDLKYYNGNNERVYYLKDDFKVEFGKAKIIYGLAIIHLNCRSLVKNLWRCGHLC